MTEMFRSFNIVFESVTGGVIIVPEESGFSIGSDQTDSIKSLSGYLLFH